MLVSKRRYLAAQEQVCRLQQELDEAHLSLTRYKEQERELVDALVAARVEARAVRNRAEDEAGSVLDGARDEALTIKAEARAQLAAAQAEITRLRDVQRELSTSLEQSLETLRSVLTHTALPQPSRAAGDQAAGEPARTPAVVLPDNARLAPITAAREHWHAADQSVSPAQDAARRGPERVTAAVPRFESFSAISSKGMRAVLALPLDRRSLQRGAGVQRAIQGRECAS